jgi:hypothetical protein
MSLYRVHGAYEVEGLWIHCILIIETDESDKVVSIKSEDMISNE